MSDLLQDVEAFLETHKDTLSPTAFGESAMNDRHLVRQMRRGRRLWPETAQKVKDFMLTYKPDQKAAAA